MNGKTQIKFKSNTYKMRKYGVENASKGKKIKNTQTTSSKHVRCAEIIPYLDNY